MTADRATMLEELVVQLLLEKGVDVVDALKPGSRESARPISSKSQPDPERTSHIAGNREDL